MRLLCHDTRCEGHERPAGSDPRGLCRYCGDALADGYGVLLIEPERRSRVVGDLAAVEICSRTGHAWEGSLALTDDELRGFCSRCGCRIALPL